MRLPPVPFHPYIAAATVCPVTVNPASMATGRLSPGTRDPDVISAVPAMVAALPNPAGMRGRWRSFIDRMRRPDSDND